MAEQSRRRIRRMIMTRHFVRRLIVGICLAALPRFTSADDTGSQLAAKLRAKESGSTLVRIRMQAGNQILQVQIKSRVSAGAADIVYQILFPKERKGESVLLHRAGNKFTAISFAPPNSIKQLGAGEINQALFGTALSYEDIIDSPLAWSQQAVVGTQDIDRFPCQILESQPAGHT